MLPRGTKIPTKPSKKNLYTEVGVYEGGGYQSKGVYRPAQECRMKINEAPVFCPVFLSAIISPAAHSQAPEFHRLRIRWEPSSAPTCRGW